MPTSFERVQLPLIFPLGRFATLTRAGSHVAYEISPAATSPSSPSPSPPTSASTATIPPLVYYCLPGLGDLRHSFRFLAPRLHAELGAAVVCQDLRGFGDSGTEFSSFEMEDLAGDVLAVLDTENIRTPVTIVGNSVCAAVAILLAADHPDRVASIITLGGFFRDVDNGLDAPPALVPLSNMWVRTLTPLLLNRLFGPTLWPPAYRSFFKRPPTDQPTVSSALALSLTADRRRVDSIAGLILASKRAAWDRRTAVRQPALVVVGSLDPDSRDPEGEAEALRSEMAESGYAEVAVVEGCGHYAQAEEPEAVLEAIKRFLIQTRAAAVVQNGATSL
ncbi:hypothetical protein HK405_011273 [Cladochytrium tenue]|nr:hypothetical protein HK405_011273 [Cladochytrium tenue]